MAALQCVARKLGGGGALQRAQAAAERRLSSLPHGRPASTSSVQPLVPKRIVDEAEVARRLKEIHGKREELYNMSAELEKYKLDFSTAIENRRLRQRLSLQVDPRPHDMDWRWLRATKRTSDFMVGVTIFAASYLFTLHMSAKNKIKSKGSRSAS